MSTTKNGVLLSLSITFNNVYRFVNYNLTEISSMFGSFRAFFDNKQSFLLWLIPQMDFHSWHNPLTSWILLTDTCTWVVAFLIKCNNLIKEPQWFGIDRIMYYLCTYNLIVYSNYYRRKGRSSYSCLFLCLSGLWLHSHGVSRRFAR